MWFTKDLVAPLPRQPYSCLLEMNLQDADSIHNDFVRRDDGGIPTGQSKSMSNGRSLWLLQYLHDIQTSMDSSDTGIPCKRNNELTLLTMRLIILWKLHQQSLPRSLLSMVRDAGTLCQLLQLCQFKQASKPWWCAIMGIQTLSQGQIDHPHPWTMEPVEHHEIQRNDHEYDRMVSKRIWQNNRRRAQRNRA